MRVLCYGLLLLNVAFFGWAQWIDAPRVPLVAPATSKPAAVIVPSTGTRDQLPGARPVHIASRAGLAQW